MIKELIAKYSPEKEIVLSKAFRTDIKESGEKIDLKTDRDIYGLTPEAAIANLLNSYGIDSLTAEANEGTLEEFIQKWEIALITLTMKKKVFEQAYEENSFDEFNEVIAASIDNLDWQIDLKPIKIDNLNLEIDENTYSIRVKSVEYSPIIK